MRLTGIVLAAMVAFSSGSVWAKNDWTGVQGNAAHTGYVDIKTNPENFHTLWSKKLTIERDKQDPRKQSMRIFPGMVVVNDVAYLSYTEYFYKEPHNNIIVPTSALIAIDTDTGETKWQKIIGYDDQITRPMYDSGRVLVGVDRDEYAVLHAYLPDSGKLDYSAPTVGYGFDGPLAYKGSVYAYSKRIYSIDSRTGKYNWTVPTEKYSDDKMPAINDKYLFKYIDKGIEALDRSTGRSVFKIEDASAWQGQALRIFPVIDESRNTVYAELRDSRVDHGWDTSIFAFDLDKREAKWSVDQSLGQPVVAGDYVYVNGVDKDNHGEFHAIDAATGKIKWTWQPTDKSDYIVSFKPIIATADLIFLQGVNKTIALSRTTHQKVWEFEKAGEMAISDNKLFVVSHTPDSKDERGTYLLTAIELN